MREFFMKWSTIIITTLLVAGCVAGTSTLMMQEKSSSSSAPAAMKDMDMSHTEQAIRLPNKASAATMAPSEGKANQASTTNNTSKEDKITSQLYAASMAFSAPETANVREHITIQLLLDPSKDLKELESKLSEPGKKTSTKVSISQIVIASLSAPDFIIEQVTPEEQAVAQSVPTEWLWTLIPKSTGKNEIKLSITAIVKIDNKEYKYHIKTYETTIVIEVKPQQVILDWLAKYWQWLFSTLLLPLGLYLYKRYKKE